MLVPFPLSFTTVPCRASSSFAVRQGTLFLSDLNPLESAILVEPVPTCNEFYL